MLYFVALFCSPLALLFAGKPFQAILNGVIWLVAWLGLFLFFVPGFIAWAVGVAHAVMVINAKKQDQRTQRVIDAMKSKG